MDFTTFIGWYFSIRFPVFNHPEHFVRTDMELILIISTLMLVGIKMCFMNFPCH